MEQKLKVKSQRSKVAARIARGIATLPVVMALSIMILAIVVGVTAITFNESFVAQGGVQSSKALFYAEVGARDALVRVARNKNYSCASPALPTGCYSIDMVSSGCSGNDGCVRVTVDTGTSPKIITAEGRAGNNARKVQVSVTLDTNGLITASSWQELNN